MNADPSFVPSLPDLSSLSSVLMGWGAAWLDATTQWQRTYWSSLSSWHETSAKLGKDLLDTWIAHFGGGVRLG